MTVMNGRMNGKKSQVKPEELIVNELIQAIESGQTKLWRKEWTVKGGFRNLLTGHEYQGGNPALLCLQSSIRNWHLPLFIGAGQARSINCLPKKGSRSARILQPLLREFETKDLKLSKCYLRLTRQKSRIITQQASSLNIFPIVKKL